MTAPGMPTAAAATLVGHAVASVAYLRGQCAEPLGLPPASGGASGAPATASAPRPAAAPAPADVLARMVRDVARLTADGAHDAGEGAGGGTAVLELVVGLGPSWALLKEAVWIAVAPESLPSRSALGLRLVQEAGDPPYAPRGRVHVALRCPRAALRADAVAACGFTVLDAHPLRRAKRVFRVGGADQEEGGAGGAGEDDPATCWLAWTREPLMFR